jgi:hypothetical protein
VQPLIHDRLRKDAYCSGPGHCEELAVESSRHWASGMEPDADTPPELRGNPQPRDAALEPVRYDMKSTRDIAVTHAQRPRAPAYDLSDSKV